jgi:dTDP-4-amino-4,6-dideoxygalactose transaminase
MQIPFVDLKKQYFSIQDEIDQAIKAVIEGTSFIGGEHVENFAVNLKNLLNINHALPVANGTDALFIALKMLGVKTDDEVITSAHSWISSSEAISQAGAKPVFVDTNQYFCIDEHLIEASITEKTKGIIPVHLYGHAANMDKIMQVATKHNLFVVEDCAQAILTKWNNSYVGTFGAAGTISFFPGKNLGAYGDAGGIITEHQELFLEMKKYANHGSLSKHMHEIEGINSRLDSLQAAILNVKIKYIETWISQRNEAAVVYREHLAGIDQITLPQTHELCDHTYHLYVIKTDFRDELAVFLKEAGIDTGIHYPKALPTLDCYKYLDLDLAQFPNAIKDCSSILSLPIFPEISSLEIEYIAEKIREFFKLQL